MQAPRDCLYELAAREQVSIPNDPKREVVAITALGVGLGATIAGPIGALAGGAAGWVVGTVRQRLVRA
jgi:hypothetical protein